MITDLGYEVINGYTLEYHAGRLQPITIWKGNRVKWFAESWDEAIFWAQTH